MLSDPDSMSVRIFIIVLLVSVHGFFTALNTALGASSRIIEKYQAANRLMQILTAILGAWYAFIDWKLTLVYFAVLMIFGQYFPQDRKSVV